MGDDTHLHLLEVRFFEMRDIDINNNDLGRLINHPKVSNKGVE